MNARIKELAVQAGLDPCVFYDNLLRISDFAELVRADERAACAKLCDSKSSEEYATGKVDHNEQSWTAVCAAAIRARGEK